MELRQEVVQKIIEKTARLQKIDAGALNENTNFAGDLGVKSTDLVLLIGTLEDEYDVDIDFMAFRKKATIGKAADYIVELCNA